MALQVLKPKSTEFLLSLSAVLEYPGDREKAKRILYAVIHALRDCLTFEQSIQVVSNLPVNLKSIFLSEWQMSDSIKHPHSDVNFIKAVVKNAGKISHYDFIDEKQTIGHIKNVFRFLELNIPENKMNVIKSCFPKDLENILRR